MSYKNTVKDYSQMIGYLTRDKTTDVPGSMAHGLRTGFYDGGRIGFNEAGLVETARNKFVELEKQRAKAEADTKKSGIFSVINADKKLETAINQYGSDIKKFESEMQNYTSSFQSKVTEYTWWIGQYTNLLNQYNSGVMSLFGKKPSAQTPQQEQAYGAAE